jgi:hypothetical protein
MAASKESLMNDPNKGPGSGSRDPADGSEDARNRTTPNTDLQPADTGSSDSAESGRGTAAESVMKQTSKTGNESGSKR